MSTNFRANPTVAPNITRPGESTEYVGTRNVSGLLPSIFKTTVNTQFLNTTLEQLMSSGSLQAINHYIGSMKTNTSASDRYVQDRTTDYYQFAPGVTNRDSDNNLTGILTYDDLLRALEFNEAQVSQPNKALNEAGYTLDLPINYDMFVNYHKYFWMIDYIPACIIQATVDNPIDVDDIIGQIYYTTPVLQNGKTLEFKNGMRISFIGDNVSNSELDALYIIDGVGDPSGIKLTVHFEASFNASPFGSKVWMNSTIYRADYQETQYTDQIDPDNVATREYVVEQRWSQDQSAWARTNLWVKEDVIHTVCDYTGDSAVDYAVDSHRATRPIIEFRANIEKYNFGQLHLTTLNHMFDSIDPIDIIGNTSWDLATQTVTTEWDTVGYEKGTQVKITLDTEVTFWDCVETHASAKNPTYYENRRYWRQITARALTNGDKVLFVNSPNASYNNKIYTVGGVGSSITLSLIFPSLTEGDKVMTINGYNSVFLDSYDGLIYAGSEWYWSGSDWVYGQQKSSRSHGILFNLYDIDGAVLDDPTVYPNSTFAGDKIFDYSKSNGLVDEGLGFAPVYVDYGNNPGFNFDIALGAVRYNYNITNSDEGYQASHDASSIEDIKGYYFYKNLHTLNLYNGWVNLRNDQPIKTKIRRVITDSTVPAEFDLGTTNISLDNKFRFMKTHSSHFTVTSESTSNEIHTPIVINGMNPVLFMSKGKTYTIQTQFDNSDLEFVSMSGGAITGVTRTAVSGDLFTLALSSSLSTLAFKYQSASDNSIYGIVYVNSNTATTNVEVYINGNITTNYTLAGTKLTLSDNYVKDTVVDVTWITNSVVNNPEVTYDVADTHIYNPQNEWLTSATFGDLQQHIKSQMTGIPGFSGDYFGDNNYDTLPRIHEFGGTIRQQAYSTELLAQTLMDTDTNPFASLKFIAGSYTKFRQQLLRKITQLHNTTDITVPVYELMDRALTELNLGKTKDSPFAHSNMVLYRDYESVDYTWTTGESVIFSLPKTVNYYDDTENHIQVWVKDRDGGADVAHWRPLLRDADYEIINAAQVRIATAFSPDATGRVYIEIRWYPMDSVSFMPPSAVKLGFIRPYTPTLINNFDTDSTGIGTSRVILCHDGSIHIATTDDFSDRQSGNFNILDAAVWELETRIFNNLTGDYDNIIDYLEIMPNANKISSVKWDDMTLALQSEFNKWKTKNNISSLSSDDYYDPLNKFTWNYKTVTPYIGGWRGIYHYFFNTDRPHSHPWEMLGHDKKPYWWDDYYSWTNVPKREALIEALKYGHYNNPDDVNFEYNAIYAYSAYNWDTNVLVTTAGVLNDPITAGVTSTPALADRNIEFVFGDWGNIENQWRTTSENKILTALGLMRVRPLWIINNYFNSNKRRFAENRTLNNHQLIFSDTKLLGNNKNVNLSYSRYADNIIEYIDVTNGGSDYGVPTLNIFENFGGGATAVAVVVNGAVIAASVTNPGGEFQSKPTVIISSGTATFNAFLMKGAKRYFNGMSNAIVEFARFNNTPVESLEDRFNTLSYTPMIKAGGFVNPNNQSFILESSQNKGRVAIPEEDYTALLYTSQPNQELFYGAVKITKSFNGYLITGYDNSNQYFNYYTPNTGTRTTIVSFGNTTVNKYRSYNNIPQRLYYNTVLPTLQAVYDFILGYGEFLNQQGWVKTWGDAAGQFVIWSTTATIGNSTNVIPSDSVIEINEGTRGYYDNINNKYDGVYNLIDSNNKQLLPNKVIISREVLEKENGVTTITAKDSNTKIYGVRMYKVEIEHAIVFNNSTQFDDVIYNPALGQLHKRIIWRGSRTKDWNGKLYSPGYLVNGNTIINNFDTTAREIDQVYAQGAIFNNNQLVDTARFNTGYNKPDWAIHLDTDNDTAFYFTQGTRKYRGTRFALNAFMRNTSLFGLAANATLYEDWAIRTADFGDVRSRNTIEFQINSELLKTSPQPIRFSGYDRPDVLTDIVIDIDTNSPLLVTGTPGNNFTTRSPKTYNNNTISAEDVYADDFITAGLPLTTETDYKVLISDDFFSFPEETRAAYSFDGDWKNLRQWDNKTSYKFKDRVIYKGRVWEMLDPDGSSGLTRPSEPITVTGTSVLPVIPSNGQTLIIDGTTITIAKTTSSVTYNPISITGTANIASTNLVAHGSTLILGTSSDTAQTISFSSTTSTLTFGNIVIVGTVINPQIEGSATKKLTLDGVDVLFNDTGPIVTNITAKAAFEDSFNSSWTVNNNTSARAAAATARIAAIENLRTAYTGSWSTFLTTYFANTAGLNISALLAEYNASPSYAAQIAALMDSDVTIINNIKGTSYIAANVLSGSETIAAGDITDSRTALNTGVYTNDISIWLQANTTTVFSVTTVVYTNTATGYQTYTLAQIVTKINAATITNLTASISSDRLVLTKTTLNNAVTFNFTITAATANAEVGITTSTTVINSTGNTTVSNPNLTITQVIDQINTAGIDGITARAAIPSGLFLNILSTSSTLYIGGGTANATIGLTPGVTAATQTITSVPVTSDLTSIITAINLAAITGVTASSGNNKLKLTSTNSTLIIGAGTANTTVGFTAQTYTAAASSVSNVFNAIVGSDGNQVFREMEYDPNIFSIWVADNSTTATANTGYAVYQSMDFGMYIADACPGITAADDAQITVAMPAGVLQQHNLVSGDYVLIRGSTTIPNIDGVHKVTGIKSNNTFYIDVYLETEGGTGNIYPLRNVRFVNYTDLVNNYNNQVNGIYKYNFSNYRQNNRLKPIYAFVDDDNSGYPAVYRYTGLFSNTAGHYGQGTWLKIRTSIAQARNDLIHNVKIYDSVTRSLITTIEVWDPAKGILPGFIDKEIEFKSASDIANYNYSNISGYTNNERAWSDQHIGVRWWNLNTAIYLDYEQSSIDYQQNNWGRLFDGATVDVYEWTRSPSLPDQWQSLVDDGIVIDGKPASGEVYTETLNGEQVYQWTEQTYYNPKTNSTATNYYFWVKNKNSYAGIRNYNTYQLAKLIENPTAYDITWCAASGADSLFVANIENFVTNNSVIQINQTYISNAMPLTEYTLLSDSDQNRPIPEQLHIKMRDSLVAYNWNKIRYNYSTYSAFTVYNKDQVVEQDEKYYISLIDSNLNHSPSVDTAQYYWSRIYEYSLVDDTIEADIDIVRSKALPDLSLHPYNRYGHLTRPNQSLIRNHEEARHNFIQTANKLISDICLISQMNGWDTVLNSTYVEGAVTYDISKYWNYIDWIRRDYAADGTLLYQFDISNVPDLTVESKFDLIPVLGETADYAENTYVYVKNALHEDNTNRPEIYRYVNNEWVLVWKKKGTIEFSEELWNQSKFGHGFDTVGFDITGFDSHLGNIISKIFDELRNRIFIGGFKYLYNQLWFSCLQQAIADNTTDDFAFKTTFVDLKIQHPLLEEKATYQNYTMDAVEEFFSSIKPFHTKLLSSTEAVTYTETNDIEITELDLDEEIILKYNNHSGRSWAGDTILSGGEFTSTFLADPYVVTGYSADNYVEDGTVTGSTAPTNEDGSTFTTPDVDIDFIYDGNTFVQPIEEGWGSEIYPVDFTENIRIRVQTNVNGATETSDTRSFQIDYFAPSGIEESIAIVDAAKTTLASSITETDTTIAVVNAALLTDPAGTYTVYESITTPRGVVWIGNERIEYGAIEGNTLVYCIRGTRGTSTTTHSNGASVEDASWTKRIPTLDNFIDYGNGLRMAYNDTGVSLSTAGTTPEHAFIRNAGFGTI
jgi:hypothetical protein